MHAERNGKAGARVAKKEGEFGGGWEAQRETPDRIKRLNPVADRISARLTGFSRYLELLVWLTDFGPFVGCGLQLLFAANSFVFVFGLFVGFGVLQK